MDTNVKMQAATVSILSNTEFSADAGGLLYVVSQGDFGASSANFDFDSNGRITLSAVGAVQFQVTGGGDKDNARIDADGNAIFRTFSMCSLP